MTIEEIKSVSIVQFLESQGYHHVYIYIKGELLVSVSFKN